MKPESGSVALVSCRTTSHAAKAIKTPHNYLFLFYELHHKMSVKV